MQGVHGEGERVEWLEPALFRAEEMRALDSWAIERQGVPSLTLMERAGAEVARVAIGLNPPGPVTIICGKGNNGGDGLVVARLLREHGLAVQVLLLWPPAQLSPDARATHELLVGAGSSPAVADASKLEGLLAGSALIVDAMLGTGFEGAPRAPIDAAIAAVNSSGVPVLAVDVPSGVNASSGEVSGSCVRASTTVTLHAPKLGLWVHPGKAHAGRVEVADIGILASGQGRPPPPDAGLINGAVLGLLEPRSSASNKFSAGTVLVVGGSTGLTGAVCLACEGAMRAGAGWVRAAVPASLNEIFEVKLTEAMTVPLPDRDGSLVGGALDRALVAAERADAVVIGPGMGRSEPALELARTLMERLGAPVVIDADALNALAGAGLERASQRPAATVLTPHAGELARLLGFDSSQISAQRLACAREAAARAGATVLLKGDDTLVVTREDARVGVSRGDSPGLASAGTGDVLSGVIAAFLSRGLEPFTAACAGVYAHAHAGRVAAEARGADSVIAGDVVEALSKVLKSCSPKAGDHRRPAST